MRYPRRSTRMSRLFTRRRTRWEIPTRSTSEYGKVLIRTHSMWICSIFLIIQHWSQKAGRLLSLRVKHLLLLPKMRRNLKRNSQWWPIQTKCWMRVKRQTQSITRHWWDHVQKYSRDMWRSSSSIMKILLSSTTSKDLRRISSNSTGVKWCLSWLEKITRPLPRQ